MSHSALAGLLARKKLLIFDFDGTLVDSSPFHAHAFQAVFEPFGIEIDYSTIAGMTTENAVDRIAEAFGLVLSPAERQALVARKRRLGRELMERDLVLLDGAGAFIDAAAERYRLALCTSGSRGTVTPALAQLGLAERFEHVVTAEDVARGKPDPQGYLRILELSGVAPAEALILEDADSGLAAAVAAGTEAVRVVPPRAAERAEDADWGMLNAALEEAWS